VKRDMAQLSCRVADVRIANALEIDVMEDSFEPAGSAVEALPAVDTAAISFVEPEPVSLYPIQYAVPSLGVPPRGAGFGLRTVTLSSGAQSQMRVRARIGRGGRVWLDRCPAHVPPPVPAPVFPARHVRWTFDTPAVTTGASTVSAPASTGDMMVIDSSGPVQPVVVS